MSYQVAELKCPGCGSPLAVNQLVCDYCHQPVTITSFNSVFSMPAPALNKYAGACRKALAEDPDNMELNNSIAMCYLKLGLYDKALPAFEKAMEDNFDNSETFFYAAVCLLQGKKAFLHPRPVIDKVLEYINAALMIEPRGIYYYFMAYVKYDYFERTGEMHFTPPVQTIYAAKQALIEYFEEGEENKWNRHCRVMKAIHDGEDRLGLREALSRDVQSGLVSAIKYPDDPNWDFDKVHDYCYERGFTIYPGKIESKGTFRLCALGAIDSGDIEDFWVVFEEAMKANNIAVPAVYN